MTDNVNLVLFQSSQRDERLKEKAQAENLFSPFQKSVNVSIN
jgi:hypothetical protein